MTDARYYFLGGIFSDSKINFILENSLGVVQNAADSFQKKIILGLDTVLKDGVIVHNFPFVGSYPSLFRFPFFPADEGRIGNKSRIIGFRFLNIFALRFISRFVSSLKALLLTPKDKRAVVFVYSAHLPFVLSAVIFRVFRRSTLTCLILPDLPEYMGDRGGIRKLLKWFDIKFFYFLVKFFDYYVFLTDFMAERLRVSKDRYVVVEGIADYEPRQNFKHSSYIKSFLYTGTLSKRYGVLNLVAAFSRLEDKSVELWICGDGDAKEEILAASKLDSRIKFFGQVDRVTSLNLQSAAGILINPREPDGDYTRFSFPSKVLEYMSSGKPVIMYKLDGISSDYDPFYISPRGLGVDMLLECMADVLTMNDEDLVKLGRNAQNFVFINKNPAIQTQKIINLFSKKV